jgi:outer membrane protein assembly factor BamB
MTGTVRRATSGVLLAAGLLATNGGAASAAPAATSVAPPPVVAAAARSGWPLPGQDYANSRRAVDSALRVSTIGQLEPAWSMPTPGALTTAAVVIGSIVYVEDDQGIVFAVDLSTGRILWQSASTGFTVGPEGVAVGWGKVFASTPTGVEALNARSGHLVWTRRLTLTPTAGVDVQPTVVGHRVLMATVPVSVGVQYQGGDRGELMAVDASTGRIDWSFDTVASKNLWGNPGVNSGGGAWYPPAVDTKTGIVYWGTANPAPFPGTAQYPNGSSRPGPNLYTDSTVALSLATGRLLWYHQAVPHDLFDQDFVNTLLVKAVSSGVSHQIVVGTGKGGQVLGMNPTTGRLVWKTSVGLHENHALTSLAGPTTVLPGTYGGVLSPPAAGGGNVYLATLNAPATLSPDQTAYFGGKVGTMNGEVVAVNAATGRHLWDTSVPGDPTGGATVVNNLVITGTLEGNLVALDRRTGKIVWTHQVGYPISGWLAAVGHFLIVPTGRVASGGHLVTFRLPTG